MHNSMGKCLISMVLIGMSNGLLGCSASQRQMDAGLSVSSIELKSSENVKLLWADCRQIDGKAHVYGTFRRNKMGRTPMKAQIDVQIISENDEILRTVCSQELNVPIRRPGRATKYERFNVEIGQIPEKSILIVSAQRYGS